MKPWTDEEISQLKELIKYKSCQEVSILLDRSVGAIHCKLKKLRLHAKSHWSDSDIEYLENAWGNTTMNTIAKNLGRSVFAVKIKAQKLQLGAFIDSGDYISYNQLLSAIGKASYSYTYTSWVVKRGLPIKYKKVLNGSFKIIYLSDFWKWAELNKDFIDFDKFPKGALGKEPKWVDDQRRLHQICESKIKTSKWTAYEDEQLLFALKRYKYTCREIANMLGRTEGAVIRRISTLGIKYRPLRENSHNIWTDEQFEKLHQCILDRVPYSIMSEQINKSEKSIRGKVYLLCGTENLDKAFLKMKECE